MVSFYRCGKCKWTIVSSVLTSCCLAKLSLLQCVNLGTYEANRVVTFIPPDGEFELMR